MNSLRNASERGLYFKMNNVKQDEFFPPDDPRLTAYALGELEGEERTEVEALLRRDPEARATVDAVRAMAGEMKAALAAESATETASALAAASEIFPASHATNVNGHDYRKPHAGPLAPALRFPQFYYVVAGLAAACFVIYTALQPPAAVKPPTEKKYYKEITLTPLTLPETARTESDPPAKGADNVTVSFSEVKIASVTVDNASLLNQVRPDGAITGRPPARAESMAFLARESLAPAPVGKMAVQSRFVIQKTTYFYPRDDGFVVRAPVRDSNRSIVAAQPKLAVPFGRLPNAPASFLSPAESLRNSVANASRGGAAGTGWMERAPFGEVRASSVASLLGILRPAPNGETYAYVRDNDFTPAAQSPLSTFSLDVDTASYANVRRFLKNGMRPPADAVRIEELVNYFPYHYAAPVERAGSTLEPIAATLEVAAAPWAPEHRLVRIGLRGREVSDAARPAANLVFLIDVSGSMNEPNKLPLVKESLRLLVSRLRPDDRVAIVTYAGTTGLALPSTPVARAQEINVALEELTPGGSTNGAMGIELAYDIAKANFVKDGVNRVILCTDGDFNVGPSTGTELSALVSEKAKSGVFLTTLGFGMGNLKDATLEQLADTGNGNYGYIDTRREAEKLLVQQVNGTLLTIAKDVKIQVDFNPARVASYRLIGYENRLLKKEDFNDDNVDAGEIGAGHTVTALYEIIPVNAAAPAVVSVPSVDASKYTVTASRPLGGAMSAELLTVRLRYKDPAGNVSKKLEFPLVDTGATFAAASPDFKFAAAVAGFGMVLRNSPHKGTATLAQVAEWATAGTVDDAGGWRAEFLELTRIAATL